MTELYCMKHGTFEDNGIKKVPVLILQVPVPVLKTSKAKDTFSAKIYHPVMGPTACQPCKFSFLNLEHPIY
jgi:hypothetical protein